MLIQYLQALFEFEISKNVDFFKNIAPQGTNGISVPNMNVKSPNIGNV